MIEEKIIVSCPSCQRMIRFSAELINTKVICDKCQQEFEIKNDKDNDANQLTMATLALKYKFITEEQLKKASEIKQQELNNGNDLPIETVLEQIGLLNQKNINILKVLHEKELDNAFGIIAIKNNFVTEKDIKKALDKQTKIFKETKSIKLIGEILVEDGFITQEQCKSILLKQQRIRDSFVPPPAEPADKTELEKDFWVKRSVDKVFGNIIIYNKFASNSDIEEALEKQLKIFEQEKQYKFLGDILVEDKKISIEQRNFVAFEQERADLVSDSDISGVVDFFETVYDSEFTIKVSNDKQLAYIIFKDISFNAQNPVTFEMIKEKLKESHIIYGIADDNLINGLLKFKGLQAKPFKIAEGKHAQEGKDAFVKYYFEIEHLTVGTAKEGDVIDFRERGTIPHVKNKALLAECEPMVKGEPGINIYGQKIPIASTRDIKLKAGKGVQLSDDGLKVFATSDGQPKLSIGYTISVLTDLDIKEDICLKTGNIYFDGNINVNGSIQNGFKVKGGNLKAKEILAADIDVTGDIKTDGGIIGATIKCQGNIRAKYISKSKINVYGDVFVQKEVLDSEIISSGAFKVEKGKIIASIISAKKGIDAVDIGTEISQSCKIRIGCDDLAESEKHELNLELTKIKEKIEQFSIELQAFEKREKEIHKKISLSAQIQDRSNVNIRNLRRAIKEFEQKSQEAKIIEANNLIKTFEAKIIEAEKNIPLLFDEQDKIEDLIKLQKEKIKIAENEIEDFNQKIDQITEIASKIPSNPLLNIRGELISGTSVAGPNVSMVIQNSIKKIKIKEIHNTDPKAEKEWELKAISVK
ncbi:MAG: DUF342 domain-containing protein [Desulfobacterales bacterium]|nr:DUF342 domain-containing protein [Desulfobacterales bacterium]